MWSEEEEEEEEEEERPQPKQIFLTIKYAEITLQVCIMNSNTPVRAVSYLSLHF